jgi:hypothetical protein
VVPDGPTAGGVGLQHIPRIPVNSAETLAGATSREDFEYIMGQLPCRNNDSEGPWARTVRAAPVRSSTAQGGDAGLYQRNSDEASPPQAGRPDLVPVQLEEG